MSCTEDADLGQVMQCNRNTAATSSWFGHQTPTREYKQPLDTEKFTTSDINIKFSNVLTAIAIHLLLLLL